MIIGKYVSDIEDKIEKAKTDKVLSEDIVSSSKNKKRGLLWRIPIGIVKERCIFAPFVKTSYYLV